jgi:predicted DNA-binding protein
MRPKRQHGKEPTKTRSIRLPIALWDRLEKKAGDDSESMNSIIWNALDAITKDVDKSSEVEKDVYNG